MVDTLNQNFIHIFIFNTFSLHESSMISSVSNGGFEWSLYFAPGSVTLTGRYLVQERTISSQDLPLADWTLLFSQRRQLLNNHLAQVPVTPNQQGIHEIWEQVLSSVGAQEGLNTSGYQVSADLDDVDFYWENDQLEFDAVFRPGIDTPSSQTAFDDLEMGGLAEKPILLDEDEDKENSPPTTTTPVSEGPTPPPALLRSRPFGTRKKMFLVMFIEVCFKSYYCVCVLNINYK